MLKCKFSKANSFFKGLELSEENEVAKEFSGTISETGGTLVLPYVEFFVYKLRGRLNQTVKQKKSEFQFWVQENLNKFIAGVPEI